MHPTLRYFMSEAEHIVNGYYSYSTLALLDALEDKAAQILSDNELITLGTHINALLNNKTR